MSQGWCLEALPWLLVIVAPKPNFQHAVVPCAHNLCRHLSTRVFWCLCRIVRCLCTSVGVNVSVIFHAFSVILVCVP